MMNTGLLQENTFDPFADSLDLENLNVEEHKDFILSNEKRDFSDLNQEKN